MIKVYTAGHMTGKGVKRKDWRQALIESCRKVAIESYYSGDYHLATNYVSNVIHFLHPAVPPDSDIAGQGNPDFYSPRDIIQVKSADVIVAYYDLEVARGLGTTIHSLDFNRQISDGVWNDMKSAAKQLMFVADGLAS